MAYLNADIFCSLSLPFCERGIRRIHIADMIHTWLGYWAEETFWTISLIDSQILAAHLVRVAFRELWLHLRDILKMPKSQVEHPPFSMLLI